MPRLRLSVVLCTFNGAAYLEEQLSSLLMQSRLPDEILIGDDASTDQTPAIIAQFGATARTRGVEVRLIRRPERLGYVTNFSHTLAAATGDVIFLADQDDAWHPDKVARMSACFVERADLTLLHSNARLVDSTGRYFGHTLFDALEFSDEERDAIRAGNAFAVYLRRNLATGAATAFRRGLLEHALPIPAVWVHDAWLSAIGAALGKVDFIKDALVDYRQHGGNQIGMAPRRWQDRVRDMVTPRGAVLESELERVQVLYERLAVQGAERHFLEQGQDASRHLAARIRMTRRTRLARLPLIAREWSSGRYARCSTGYRSALRDLLRAG